jgi:hypothetical protein
MTEDQFAALTQEAQEELTSLNTKCGEAFKLGTYGNWDYDSEAGTITFSTQGTPKVVAQVQVVGTTSAKSKTWLWAWANDSVPRPLVASALTVRDFGQREGVSALVEPELPDDEFIGWEMTAITAKLVGGIGGYRTPRAVGGYTFYLFTGINWAQSPA